MIRTERLILRRANWGDLPALHRMLSDPAVMRYWSRPEHATLQESRDFLASMVEPGPDSDEFVIEFAGDVIGKAGSWRLPEIGYLLDRAHWGKGLMREALRAVIDHLFASHPVAALTADVDPRNLASIRLLQALGFVETGRAERTVKWREEWCDSLYLALSREKHPAAASAGARGGRGTLAP